MACIEETFERACYVCGNRSEQAKLGHKPCDYRVDLDRRPSELTRQRKALGLQVCPTCGYASHDVSVGDQRILEVVNSDEYRAQAFDSELPAFARKCLCAALLIHPAEGGADLNRVYWQQWAAWACEDDVKGKAAATCRGLAARSLTLALEASRDYFVESGAAHVVIADLFRQNEEFEAAHSWLWRGLERRFGTDVRLKLLYEYDLIAASDAAPHLEDETPGLEALRIKDDDIPF